MPATASWSGGPQPCTSRARPPPRDPPSLPPPFPGPPASRAPPVSVADRHVRAKTILPTNLADIVHRLKRTNMMMRQLFHQHETAWHYLRMLFNWVVVIQKLVERLRDMFTYVSFVGGVAKGVNVYADHVLGDADAGAHDAPSVPPEQGFMALQEEPYAWSMRVLVTAEKIVSDMHTVVTEIEGVCSSAAHRRASKMLPNPGNLPPRWSETYLYVISRRLGAFQDQLDGIMASCKFIHMVPVTSMYKELDRPTDKLDKETENETHARQISPQDPNDMPSFYSFWSEMGLAAAGQNIKNLEKRRKKDKASVTIKKSGKKRKGDPPTTQADQQPRASNSDLLAAMVREDYPTLVTLLMSNMKLNDLLEDGSSVLSHAVDENNAILVSALAVCGASPNIRHKSGCTPLHVACSTNSIAPAIILLELGAEVGSRDAMGMTPLHVACRKRFSSLVLQLLAHGADPNACDYYGVTPLGYALLHPKRLSPSRNMMSALLAYGARATGPRMTLSPVAEAIFRYDSALIKRYIVDCPSLAEAETVVMTRGAGCDDDGSAKMYPLYAAVLAGNIFAINLLLRNGADVNRPTLVFGQSMTPLSLAVATESTALVARLLLSDADPNIVISHGQTALHLAASLSRADVEITSLLLRHGADFLATTTERGIQPLHVALRFGRGDVCDLLLKYGASVNAPMNSGVTPVMLATYYGHKMALRFLVSRCGDLSHKTPVHGETAMHAACRTGNVALAIYLKHQGMSANAESSQSDNPEGPAEGASEDTTESKSEGTTECFVGTYAPMHIAASRGHLEMVHWLLSEGADPEPRIGPAAARECLGMNDDMEIMTKNRNVGMTPVDVARAFGYEKAAEVVEDHILAAKMAAFTATVASAASAASAKSTVPTATAAAAASSAPAPGASGGGAPPFSISDVPAPGDFGVPGPQLPRRQCPGSYYLSKPPSLNQKLGMSVLYRTTEETDGVDEELAQP